VANQGVVTIGDGALAPLLGLGWPNLVQATVQGFKASDLTPGLLISSTKPSMIFITSGWVDLYLY